MTGSRRKIEEIINSFWHPFQVYFKLVLSHRPSLIRKNYHKSEGLTNIVFLSRVFLRTHKGNSLFSVELGAFVGAL
jgi:hypothetical protein